ncbi:MULTISPECIES: hypothetical protein [Neisseria]|nr:MULTISPECIES: hypothetical protein [Neisseria]MBF0804897.1 hypothetical protein [Neisseria sp. 19428wB4_WF04]TFU39393.1 hypothetical protein E4T99_11360 [Neisseria sp. WF04]
MLYYFLCDMWDILRLRYKNPADYRYPFIVAAAVLLLIGLVNAASTALLFGKSPAVVALTVLLTVLKCAVLSLVMGRMLPHGKTKLPMWGFVLASEALSVPLLVLFYAPALAAAGMFWQIWIFVAQAVGFIRMSGRPGWRVMSAYLVYAVLTVIAGSALLTAAAQTGLIDLDALAGQAKVMLESGPQAR